MSEGKLFEDKLTAYSDAFTDLWDAIGQVALDRQAKLHREAEAARQAVLDDYAALEAEVAHLKALHETDRQGLEHALDRCTRLSDALRKQHVRLVSYRLWGTFGDTTNALKEIEAALAGTKEDSNG